MRKFSLIARLGMALGAVLIISLLFPDSGLFKYRYDIGKTWNYDDLYAPYDFAILKDQETIDAEKKALIKNKEYVFIKDLEVYDNVVSNTSNEIQKYLSSIEDDITKSYLLEKDEYWYDSLSVKIIKSVYKNGIVEIPDSLKGDHLKVINIISGSTYKSVSVNELLSISQAKRLTSKQLGRMRYENTDFMLPIIISNLVPDILFDSVRTQQFMNEKLAAIIPTNGVVKNAERIVSNGEVVTKDVYQKMISFQKYFESEVNKGVSKWMLFAGYFLLTFLIIGVLLIYLSSHFASVFNNWKELAFILMWFVVLSYLVYYLEQIEVLNIYIIPFCVVPIIINNFYNNRLALFVHVLIILLASFLSSLGYEFTFLQIFAGIVAILMASETRAWSEFFRSIVFIFLAYVLGYLGLSLIQGNAFNEIEWNFVIWFLMNSFFILLAYPLIPLLERLFGFTSSITLVEFSDLNQSLLKELSMKAPGTMQHSLQVANLAEAAADKIGANSLLVKVAALYHDIGKTLHPTYFIENQSGVNPHEELTPLESAERIIEHVTEGEKMAKKAGIPKVLSNFIVTHHGDTVVQYFYQKQKGLTPEKEVSVEPFKYPGPRPVTKEETILMIADSIEAASKSLKNPDMEDINELFDQIVRSKIEQGQLDESELTFSELGQVVDVIKSVLKSIYHIRIKYPGQK